MNLEIWQLIAGLLSTAIGGAGLTYLAVPKKDLIGLLFERLDKMEKRTERQDDKILELIKKVEDCEERHRSSA